MKTQMEAGEYFFAVTIFFVIPVLVAFYFLGIIGAVVAGVIGMLIMSNGELA